MNKIKYLIVSLTLLGLISCNSEIKTPTEKPKQPESTKSYNISGKWYTNPDDDRYYYDFRSDGTLVYSRLNTGIGSTKDSFVTYTGDWGMSNQNSPKFYARLQSSIANEYEVISINNSTLTIKKTQGSGLSISETTFYKTAKKVDLRKPIPQELSGILTTWYYDETLDGNYISFTDTGKVYYHYYIKPSNLSTNKDGWKGLDGTWSYNENTHLFNITMSGEIGYSYEINQLTDHYLKLKNTNSSISSSIYKNGEFYK